MENHKGSVDGIAGGVLFGWAVDTADPVRPVELEILVGNKVVGKATADLPRPDISYTANVGGRCGFIFDLSSYLGDVYPQTVIVRAVLTGRPLSGSPLEVTEQGGWGSLDGLHGIVASGWAVVANPAQPHAVVEILVDGKPVGTTSANLDRPDLRLAGLPQSKCGFQFTIPLSMCDGQNHTVTACIAGSGRLLRGGEKSVRAAFKSYVDHVSLERVSGWIVNVHASDVPVKLDIYIDEALVATTEASRSRMHIASSLGLKIEVADCGFDVALPRLKEDWKIRRLRLCFANTTDSIGGGEHIFFRNDFIVHAFESIASTVLLQPQSDVTGSQEDAALIRQHLFPHLIDQIRKTGPSTHVIVTGPCSEGAVVEAQVDERERVLLNQVDHEPPLPPSSHQFDGKQLELPPIPLNAEPPTQRLQDFLYDEFGLGQRSRIVFGMQRFLLPLNADLRQPTPTDDDLAELAGIVGAMAELIPVYAQPDVSIIVPAYNQVRFTLACLHSILVCNTKFTFELIVADDCSNDATHEVFAQGLCNIRHVRSASNVGFLRNCNNAARGAKGRVIVFLNNDTYVLPGWLDYLIETLDANSDIGLVGSKLIFSDGRMQECGGLIFSDGSGWNYGRYDDPRKPEYSYLRDSDYVSGASIAISRELWKNLGGFDERYEMAYYEDTDLAFQVRQAGKRVVVQPLSQLIHFEGISSGTDVTTGVKRYQVVNGEIFRQRWAKTIAGYGSADPNRLPIHRGSKGTILVIDARTPMPDRDSGSMDTYQYLRILKSFGYHVVFVPENLVHAGHYSAELQRIGVQVLYAPFWTSFEQILSALGASLDYVLIYRVPVAAAVYDVVRSRAPQAKIIFDTVDLHFLRLAREAELAGDEEKKLAAERMKLIELDMIRKADATIVLSQFEMDLLKKLIPDAALFEIPIVRQVPPPRTKGFDQRRDVVFVGGFEHGPNVDAVQWFVAEVMPRLQARGFIGQFVVVGSNMPLEIKALARPGVIIRGFVPDLEELFSEIRLSVAPLRYGAGLKGKVITSLSYGVPVVATTVAVEGGGFSNDVNVLVADKPDELAESIMRVYEDVELWEQISCAGYQYFKEQFSVETVACKLEKLLSAS